MRRLAKSLQKQGISAEYNDNNRCVDVFDSDGNLIEERFLPEPTGTKIHKKFRYHEASQEELENPEIQKYVREDYFSELQDFSDEDTYNVYVHHTNRDKKKRV